MTNFISVAIPYVNSDPHLGYVFELVETDIFARAMRMSGKTVKFVGGTDEYSLKNVLAAEQSGTPIEQFIEQKAARFQQLSTPLDLSFDDYVRTSTDSRHRPAVEALWKLCDAAGDLYKKEYSGRYCAGCERYYAAEELLPDGTCAEHNAPVELISETNWFFRLSRYQQLLIDLIEGGQVAVEPQTFCNEVLSFLKSSLEDLSLSRSAQRAHGWGIPVPGDPEQVIYVWFDALTNYISSLGFVGDQAKQPDFETFWTEADSRTHCVGKGITRFHAVYWPAFLMSAGQLPPSRIQVHAYLTSNGQKLSKSAGNAVDPLSVVDQYGIDALRWWFAREVSPIADTDCTVNRMIERANIELANGIGNAVNRIATLATRYLNGRLQIDSSNCITGCENLSQQVLSDLCDYDRRAATDRIVTAIAALNTYLASEAPWLLARQSEWESFTDVLSRSTSTAIQIGQALEPIVPRLSKRIRHSLTPVDGQIPPPKPTFPRLKP